ITAPARRQLVQHGDLERPILWFLLRDLLQRRRIHLTAQGLADIDAVLLQCLRKRILRGKRAVVLPQRHNDRSKQEQAQSDGSDRSYHDGVSSFEDDRWTWWMAVTYTTDLPPE